MKRIVKSNPFEGLCSVLYFGWSMAFFIDPNSLKLPIYSGFKWSAETYSVIFFLLFIGSLFGLSIKNNHRFIAGYTMICGAFAWFLVSVKFVLAYPPLSPEMFTFFVLACACLIRGVQIIETSKKTKEETHTQKSYDSFYHYY